jgi:hypothetical protein
MQECSAFLGLLSIPGSEITEIISWNEAVMQKCASCENNLDWPQLFLG